MKRRDWKLLSLFLFFLFAVWLIDSSNMGVAYRSPTRIRICIFILPLYIEGRAPIQSDGCWEKKEKKNKSEKFWMRPRSTRLSYSIYFSRLNEEKKKNTRETRLLFLHLYATSMVPIFQPIPARLLPYYLSGELINKLTEAVCFVSFRLGGSEGSSIYTHQLVNIKWPTRVHV